eukprot:1059400-Alexandrium_andersonii.AAC.1
MRPNTKLMRRVSLSCPRCRQCAKAAGRATQAVNSTERVPYTSCQRGQTDRQWRDHGLPDSPSD